MESTHSDAIARRGDDHAIVYWRPGCPYCEHLLAGLDPSGERISLVNIWTDPEAAAFVASLQDGNELVPTVVVGERVLTAPDGPEVLAALG
ncbi:glutaredoxin domain-containing protein [Luteococcus sp. H138]|uniref:glutaredoxin domain-containing protein n=1 Tax=unclassified Luteococcus TaxID=2639923 RepID=UPI00313C8753